MGQVARVAKILNGHVEPEPAHSSYGYSLTRYRVMTSANSMSIMKGRRAIWRDARWTLALGNCGGYAAAVMVRIKALAPYALIELVLPGGSMMALLLWLYRRRKSGVGFGHFPPLPLTHRSR